MLCKRQFYKPFYDYWLDINVLKGYIQAPGYLVALEAKDYMTLEAYRNCRFIGPMVPHIDPVKEVNAMRTKLGGKLKDIPLTTVGQVMEELSTGDFDNVINKVNNEIETVEEFLPVDNTDPASQPSSGPASGT